MRKLQVQERRKSKSVLHSHEAAAGLEQAVPVRDERGQRGERVAEPTYASAKVTARSSVCKEDSM
jgi:hypothetical protein